MGVQHFVPMFVSSLFHSTLLHLAGYTNWRSHRHMDIPGVPVIWFELRVLLQ